MAETGGGHQGHRHPLKSSYCIVPPLLQLTLLVRMPSIKRGSVCASTNGTKSRSEYMRIPPCTFLLSETRAQNAICSVQEVQRSSSFIACPPCRCNLPPPTIFLGNCTYTYTYMHGPKHIMLLVFIYLYM